jgi:hypothetical protein
MSEMPRPVLLEGRPPEGGGAIERASSRRRPGRLEPGNSNQRRHANTPGRKRPTAVIIGGGIHGITVALALAKSGVEVTLVDKREGLLRGTSAATQNRAHLGYHYPRSVRTAAECLQGLRVFQERYPQALAYPHEAYYLVEKYSSRISAGEFKAFCDEMRIPYEMRMPSNGFIHRDAVVASFRVPEPVFNLEVLQSLLDKEIGGLGIRVQTGWEVVRLDREAGRFRIRAKRAEEEAQQEADILVNATYAYANNVLKMLGLDEEMTEYVLQRTEVPIARSSTEVPALTVMDGEFVSVLPYGHKQNYVLLYDVIHSVVHREKGYLYDDAKEYPTNWDRMLEHGERYFPFLRSLEYVGSLWGARPIPVRATGDSRMTRILAHRKQPGAYSIMEGKFISAPLIADRLVAQMAQDGVVR